MATFSFPIRALKAAAIAASNERARYYLNGVFVEPCGDYACFVATDGHRLNVFRVTGAIGKLGVGIIIPTHVIAQIKIAARDVRAQPEAALIVEGGKYALQFDGVTYAFEPIDATYPDWRRITPSEVSGESYHFNASYLEDFNKALQIASGRKDARAFLHQNGQNPALVEFQFEEKSPVQGFGVLMPYRGPDVASFKRPEWANGVSPVAEPETEAQAA